MNSTAAWPTCRLRHPPRLREFFPAPVSQRLRPLKSLCYLVGQSRPQHHLQACWPCRSPIVSFDGLNFVADGAGWPPDTVGDVGPNHYIQAVNTSFGVFNKTTGAKLAGTTFNALWATAPAGPCNGSNNGDVTVVYDPMADRWFIADFAWVNSSGPFYECIAVSKTSDPVAGGWWLYPVRADDNANPFLPDYPKMGIWPDGLYMTANMFDLATAGTPFMGVRTWAFNRTVMEAGSPLQSVFFDLSNTYFGLLPGNLRGTLPPAGREEFLVAESQLVFGFDVWKFHVDWTTPANSTLTGPTTVTQTVYTLADLTVPTPANPLDSLYERLMMQAQYRNINGIESLWVNHTVKTGPTGVTGIQWAQLNVTGGTIAAAPVQQEIYGNLNNDGLHRWMGSLAVDQVGNMALGYSVADPNTPPDIRYNGRLVTDPLGTLPQGENGLLTGLVRGSQAGDCGGALCERWGDYSAMTIDPDGCTFWYTNEYYSTDGTNWQTRIGSFKFPSCSFAAISLVKSASSATYDHVGQVITYTLHHPEHRQRHPGGAVLGERQQAGDDQSLREWAAGADRHDQLHRELQHRAG